MKTGNKNLITDVKGILVGNSQDETLKSGVTVLSGESRFNAAVTVLGGAPGTRETDLLETDKLVQQVDALVLSGGSVYGLDAAAGVVDSLRLEGKGYGVQDIKVPIVPGAILFDLLNGGNKKWKINPYSSLGKKAYLDRGKSFKLGTVGAGTGATTSNLKGGLGSASVKLDNGINVGALVAVNSFGSSIIPGSKCFWASPFELNEEYGGIGFSSPNDPFDLEKEIFNYDSLFKDNAKKNTTIAIVATDCDLNRSQLKRISVAAHDGISRSIVPAHTPFDGDLIFSVSTGQIKNNITDLEIAMIGHCAGVCLSRAIARGVYEAIKTPKDNFPTWSNYSA